ncbi:MAG: hypothetical protein KC776_29150 [Myxococcales bacterium]|nr:hypothetical protein [Myxococcales bacterium]MCB9576751.1 hypothetical protein [Polyangiaceae bacterium]
MARSPQKPPEDPPEKPDLAAAIDEARDVARLVVALAEGMAILDEGNNERVRAVSSHYWRAVTHGWSAERHARVYLLEVVRSPPAVAGWPIERLPAPVRAGTKHCGRPSRWTAPNPSIAMTGDVGPGSRSGCSIRSTPGG